MGQGAKCGLLTVVPVTSYKMFFVSPVCLSWQYLSYLPVELHRSKTGDLYSRQVVASWGRVEMPPGKPMSTINH